MAVEVAEPLVDDESDVVDILPVLDPEVLLPWLSVDVPFVAFFADSIAFVPVSFVTSTASSTAGLLQSSSQSTNQISPTSTNNDTMAHTSRPTAELLFCSYIFHFSQDYDRTIAE